MCLAKVWTDEQMNEWLEGQGEVIEVWKAVSKWNTHNYFSAPCEYMYGGYPAARGIAQQIMIKQGGFRYMSGFHFCLTKADAKAWGNFDDGICIKCYIKKEWIIAIGAQPRLFAREGDPLISIIVASQAIFPHYPETEARYEDIPQEQMTVSPVGQEG